MDWRTFFGIAAIGLGMVSYVPYFAGIFRGTVRPHAFTWLIWFALSAIAWAGQVTGDGGAGAWVTGLGSIVSLAVFGLALRFGRRDFPLADWLSLAGAAVALGLWRLTGSALLAVLLATFIDVLGFLPTFRKSFAQPWQEPLVTYILGGAKYAVSIAGMQHLTPLTTLFPAGVVLANAVFVAFLLVRRRQARLHTPGALAAEMS